MLQADVAPFQVYAIRRALARASVATFKGGSWNPSRSCPRARFKLQMNMGKLSRSAAGGPENMPAQRARRRRGASLACTCAWASQRMTRQRVRQVRQAQRERVWARLHAASRGGSIVLYPGCRARSFQIPPNLQVSSSGTDSDLHAMFRASELQTAA